MKGKKVLILGVANKRSLAWAMAQRFSAAGAELFLTYQGERFQRELDKLVKDLPVIPKLAVCDVTREEDIAALGLALHEWGGVDVLVHSLAFAPPEAMRSEFSRATRQAFITALEISAYSLVALTRMAIPLFEARGGGSVMTLSYLGAERIVPGYHIMGVAKAALEASVRYLAYELAPKGIRVNAISPGPVRTLSAAGVSGFNKLLDAMPDKSVLRRNITPEEVAELAFFLAGQGGRPLTGETLYVDAGCHLMGA